MSLERPLVALSVSDQKDTPKKIQIITDYLSTFPRLNDIQEQHVMLDEKGVLIKLTRTQQESDKSLYLSARLALVTSSKPDCVRVIDRNTVTAEKAFPISVANLLRLAQGVEPRLIRAIREGDSARVRYLLEQKADPNVTTKIGFHKVHRLFQNPRFSALDIALSRPDAVDFVKPLLEAGAICDFGQRMSAAIQEDRLDVLALLLEKKADPSKSLGDVHTNDLMRSLIKDPSPLELAIRSHVPRCVDALIAAKAKVSSTNSDGDSPLHIAARFKDSNTVKKLLDAKANPAAVNRLGNTALHEAIARGQTGTALTLFYKQSIEEPNLQGLTPMQLVDQQIAAKKKSQDELLEKISNLKRDVLLYGGMVARGEFVLQSDRDRLVINKVELDFLEKELAAAPSEMAQLKNLAAKMRY